MYLVIDVGNTRVKAAVFECNNVKELFVFSKSKIISEIKIIVNKYNIEEGIISSVALLSEIKFKKLQNLLPLTQLTAQLKVPFKNMYATPKTLGVDRIALISAAVSKYPNKNVLVVDAGTCITFDFVTRKKEYLGGAISPGIAMRYKALHKFTAKLPLLKTEKPNHFIGNTTNNSIHSGVVNGICKEIDGIIQQYNQKYKDLTIVLTGGDMIFLLNQLKNSIFASPNFILEGLYTILIYNKKND